MFVLSLGRFAQVRHLLLVCCTAVALAACLTGPGVANDNGDGEIGNKVWVFDIPSQNLRTALQTWSDLTGLDWAHVGGSLEGIDSPGVTGPQTTNEALKHILAETGFTYVVMPSGGYAIVHIKTGATA